MQLIFNSILRILFTFTKTNDIQNIHIDHSLALYSLISILKFITHLSTYIKINHSSSQRLQRNCNSNRRYFSKSFSRIFEQTTITTLGQFHSTTRFLFFEVDAKATLDIKGFTTNERRGRSFRNKSRQSIEGSRNGPVQDGRRMGSGSRVPRTMVVIQIPCRARSIFIRPPREFTSVASPPRQQQ